jgi:hypothetical protein
MNSFFASSVASSAALNARRVITYVTPLVLVLAVAMFFVLPVWAESDSSSSISVTSVTITPASGTVVFTDPWSSQVFAQAQNSLGGFNQNFNSSNMSQIVSTNAMVQFATGQALADPTNLLMNTTNAMSTVNIPTVPLGFLAASSQGTADIFNSTFMVTGGTGQVNVTFNAMLNSLQSLFTDIHGISATSEVIFTLAINGNTVLFRDSPLAIGPNMTLVLPFSGMVGPNSMMLNYNQDYTLFMELDAESSGQSMPEPSTIALLVSGPALAFARRWIMAKRA